MTDPNPYEPSRNKSQPSEFDLTSKLVVLAKYDNSPEAHALKNELENHGVRASVGNETSAQSVGASLFGRIGAVSIEVLVLESDAERALAIRHAFESNESTAEIGEWTCSCGEVVDAGFAQCWSCMKPHPDTE